MRSALVFTFIALTGLPACRGLLGGACDQEALRAAADATDAMMKAWDPRLGAMPDYKLAVRGIEAACPDLPEGFRGYFELTVQPQPERLSHEMPAIKPLRDDAEGMRPIRAFCPEHARIADSMGLLAADERLPAMYDGCKFAELGLIDRGDITDTMDDPQAHHAHALLLWLVDGGAPREVARALVRPILAATDRVLEIGRDVRPPATQQRGAPLKLWPTLLVTPYQMRLDTGRIVNLKDGVIDEPDFSPRSFGWKFASLRDDSASSELMVAADVSLRWVTLGPALHAAWRAGYTEISIAALTPTPLRPLVGLRLVTAGPGATASLTLSPTQVTLQCEDHEVSTDLPGLAAELARCPGPMRFAATPDTALPRVVELLDALAGKAAIVELTGP